MAPASMASKGENGLNFFRQIIEDASGGSSTVRFNAVVANVTACLVWFVAAIAAIAMAWRAHSEIKLPDVPIGIAGYCLGALGLKVLQRGEEEPK
jgi:hypothetical protein